MLAALALAARRGHRDTVRLLSTVLILGILGEIDTWTTLRQPGIDPLGTACVALDLILPAGLILETVLPCQRRGFAGCRR
jgi:hypothetical protein